MASPIDSVPGSGSCLASIPEGYVMAMGPDNKKYVVPLHLVDNLKQAFESYRCKVMLGVQDWLPAANQRLLDTQSEYTFGEQNALFPSQSVISEQERLALHAEILAVQRQTGMSYKDAAYSLYMGEIAKAKVAYESSMAFEVIADGLKASMTKVNVDARNTEL